MGAVTSKLMPRGIASTVRMKRSTLLCSHTALAEYNTFAYAMSVAEVEVLGLWFLFGLT